MSNDVAKHRVVNGIVEALQTEFGPKDAEGVASAVTMALHRFTTSDAEMGDMLAALQSRIEAQWKNL